jgi:hypothetical protein
MKLRARATLAVLALSSVLAAAQAQPESRQFTINGHTGQANVVRISGHSYVDLEALARIANGSLGFRGNHILLNVPTSSAPATRQPVGLSREFMRAGIDQLGAVREWVTTLTFIVRNGYPVTGSWVEGYRGRVIERLRLASVTAVTPSDRRAVQLLSSLSGNLQTWSDGLVSARNALNAELTINPSTVESDPMNQKIITCEQFLSSMLVGGTFTDNASCH